MDRVRYSLIDPHTRTHIHLDHQWVRTWQLKKHLGASLPHFSPSSIRWFVPSKLFVSDVCVCVCVCVWR